MVARSLKACRRAVRDSGVELEDVKALVMNLAGQLARLTEHEGVEELAKSRTARLLKIGLPELMRLRFKSVLIDIVQ